MVDIKELKPLIIERLKPLNPSAIILFGSYAYGMPNKNSDIDLFIATDDSTNNIDAIALLKLKDLMKKYKIGFDILTGKKEDLLNREDPFFKVDILQKGIKIYGK